MPLSEDIAKTDVDLYQITVGANTFPYFLNMRPGRCDRSPDPRGFYGQDTAPVPSRRSSSRSPSSRSRREEPRTSSIYPAASLRRSEAFGPSTRSPCTPRMPRHLDGHHHPQGRLRTDGRLQQGRQQDRTRHGHDSRHPQRQRSGVATRTGGMSNSEISRSAAVRAWTSSSTRRRVRCRGTCIEFQTDAGPIEFRSATQLDRAGRREHRLRRTRRIRALLRSPAAW